MRLWVALGGLAAMGAIVLGAVGAHRFAPSAGQDGMARWDLAVRYQMIHAIALIAVGLLSTHLPGARWLAVGATIFTGLLLFSGSLYLLVGTGNAWFGRLTPLGGTLLIVGWLLLVLSVLRK